MKIHSVLLFCFLSALCGGKTGLVCAKLDIFTGAEGGNGTIYCYLSLSGSMKFFCREQCKEEDILIKTDGAKANRGKYSIEYKDGSSGRGILYMTFTHLSKSDSGQYRCGLGKTSQPDSFADFEIRVSDELLDKNSGFVRTVTEGEKVTYGCDTPVKKGRMFFCKSQCEREDDVLIDTSNMTAQSGRYSIEYIEESVFKLYVTISPVTKSDRGWYRCGYGSPSSQDSFLNFQVFVLGGPVSASTSTAVTTQSLNSSASPVTTEQFKDITYVSRPVYFLPLVVCIPAVAVLLLVVVLLLLYKQKMMRNFGRNTSKNKYVTNAELSVTYENWDAHQDPVYQNLDPACGEQDQTYSAFTDTENNK